MGRADDALESFTQARETRERLAREEPSLPELQGDLARTIASIAAARLGQGRPAEALASYAQSREIRERLARENPHLPELAAELGGVLSSMASIDMDAKNWEHARPLLENAIRWRRKALDASPTTAEYRRLLSEDLDKLIKAAEALGNNDAAAQARRELEELIKGAPSP
jgi:tetratricopeptide (TPR) repeat protein